MTERVVIGVDESGTGAWAGPYSVCAVAAYAHDSELLRRVGARDSKKMTDVRRRHAIIAISDVILFACNVMVSVKDIDERKNDAWRAAIYESVRHVVERVRARGIADARIEIVIDGLPDPRVQKRINRELGVALAVRFLTSAEDQIPAVGAASVIAKTERNDAMRELHERHPLYGWNKNYGYGTKVHAVAIQRHGRTIHHRDIKLKSLGGS